MGFSLGEMPNSVADFLAAWRGVQVPNVSSASRSKWDMILQSLVGVYGGKEIVDTSTGGRDTYANKTTGSESLVFLPNEVYLGSVIAFVDFLSEFTL